MKRLLTLIALAVCFALAWSAVAERVPPGTDDEIRERLQPFGEVCVAGAECAGMVVAVSTSGEAQGRSGEEVYNTFCFACHGTGVSGAPLAHSSEQWAPRLDKGMDAIWTSTINGLGAMPPKGTCMNCSDDELHAAIEYMSGG